MLAGRIGTFLYFYFPQAAYSQPVMFQINRYACMLALKVSTCSPIDNPWQSSLFPAIYHNSICSSKPGLLFDLATYCSFSGQR